MPKLASLINNLKKHYPHLTFTPSTTFSYRQKTIHYDPTHPKSALLTLHELAHALLDHKDYKSHLELLKIESATWQKTKSLAQKYFVPYDEPYAQQKLDTYRDHLHQKSLCKIHQINRYQDKTGHYHCPLCTPKTPPTPQNIRQ
jgi:hypothetical protein